MQLIPGEREMCKMHTKCLAHLVLILWETAMGTKAEANFLRRRNVNRTETSLLHHSDTGAHPWSNLCRDGVFAAFFEDMPCVPGEVCL